MPPHGPEVPLPLRHAIATCRLLFNCTYDEIERKTGVPASTAGAIMRRAIHRAGCEDFREVLVCIDNMERPGRPSTRVDVDDDDVEGGKGGGSGGVENGIGSGSEMAVADPKGAEAAVDVTTATSTMSNHLDSQSRVAGLDQKNREISREIKKDTVKGNVKVVKGGGRRPGVALHARSRAARGKGARGNARGPGGMRHSTNE
ncbi:hypothetical protein MMC29_001120 [Sticta canariensis]|nr:hypothetical protein [Sticta canariensis]